MVDGSRSRRWASSWLVHSLSWQRRRILSRKGLATALICSDVGSDRTVTLVDGSK